MKFKTFYFFIPAGIVALILAFFFLIGPNLANNLISQDKNNGQAIAESLDKIVEIKIEPNKTYDELMKDQEIADNLSQTIYNETKSVYDLAKIKAGYVLVFTFNKADNALKQLKYAIDTEQELFINNENGQWAAVIKPIEYEIKIKTVEGKIDSSLYESAMAKQIDERAVVEFGDIFDWTIDFAQDPRVGDTYKFIYEERYRDGQYVMPGQILAAKYVNAGTNFKLFYFADGSETGYYDENGLATQKMFLKAPVSFKYISSGFTTGSRYLSAFNISTGHRAIDYAATYGTPIRSVADGTVVFAGWQSGYGNKITIRHNGTYSTNYCHQSKFAVKVGQKVKQGQTIGYVGSTGLSTGPHLHYEMVKNGVKINPLLERQPPGKPISSANKEAFQKIVDQYTKQLD